MEALQKTYENHGSLHHAYIVLGGEAARENLLRFLNETLGFRTRGNPDHIEFAYEVFGIDEARRVKEIAAERPIGQLKVFVITAKIMTTEAQNALLKLLEEPARETLFFFLVSRAVSLIPTLLSRVLLINERGEAHDLWAGFLLRDIPERLIAVRKIIDAKDQDSAIALLNTIEEELHEARAREHISLGDYCFIVNEIGNCRGHLRGRSPSLKLVLEHIAIVAPYIQT
ncbi:MAG: hypothetical protein COW88_01650 [Candidatus Lloydbacteria bacterium CG22_combo_CG10-13_8_21_14_all_47_15]|uniref:DNA polymerase III subunit delta n=1 Tax=Candidatus Lloydbacteria bacterium CG22_combo_CG10-13_8_21_14_all_47_15 TaxID=1974635 RepID=A0A2H0CUC7_9BACT|nr:MAG: hypothetical protein COW88_01650 [Candidatus Lloydbacteria bacterium CG22_combo_CG10-13_8_21_14_all_47_15]